MDKSWMRADRLSLEYELGVEEFLTVALGRNSLDTVISCPCVKCNNGKSFLASVVKDHLFWNVSDFTLAIYQMYLYEVIVKSRMTDSIRMVAPSDILATNTSNTPQQQSKALAKRFESARNNTLYLLPYHSSGHWNLTVIHPAAGQVYFMNPLDRKISVGEWPDIVNCGLRIYNSHREKLNHTWKVHQWKNLLGMPAQGSKPVLCGYFVMRYMKDIVEDTSLGFFKKWDRKGDHVYTQEHFDEVRQQWAQYFSDNFI